MACEYEERLWLEEYESYRDTLDELSKAEDALDDWEDDVERLRAECIDYIREGDWEAYNETTEWLQHAKEWRRKTRDAVIGLQNGAASLYRSTNQYGQDYRDCLKNC
jgi:hypothetical protein